MRAVDVVEGGEPGGVVTFQVRLRPAGPEAGRLRPGPPPPRVADSHASLLVL
ncbi:hypothetical protein AB0L65_50995 [Nonomuraea sp. NPDC052116]|uniref:hypothetical protein n=1 Tax=Nonomuraea sp. NPDC052116 TaxID=3155665 RepID=UPI0034261B93